MITSPTRSSGGRRPGRAAALASACALAVLTLVGTGHAAKLDFDPNPALDPLVAPLDRAGIDVLGSWESVGAELPPDRPRLAPLAPFRPDEAEIAGAKWRYDYDEGSVGGLAFVPYELEEDQVLPPELFDAAWQAAPTRRRVFVTFTRADLDAARRLRSVLEDEGWAGSLLVAEGDADAATALFRGAGRHAVLDSPATRANGGIWLQAWMLDTIRRSIGFDAVEPEPERQRVALGGGGEGTGEDARAGEGVAGGGGGARTRSVLPEPPPATVDDLLGGRATFESLPGGILFGQTASGEPRWRGSRLVIGPDERVVMISPDGRRRARLPAIGLADLRPCFEFALRSNPSQSAVHIDATRRVSIAPEFFDTGVGLRLIEVDSQPFRWIQGTQAQKSILFDRAVEFRTGPDGDLVFHVVLDVWFMVPARDGKAKPILTLQYESSDRNPSQLVAGAAQGRTGVASADARGELGRAIAPAARYAAWIGFFRWADASDVQLDELWSALADRDFPPVRTPRYAPRA